MAPSLPLLTLLSSTLPLTHALPLQRRGPSPRTIGTNVAIAISLLIFSIFIFYLGVRRGQTGSWFCWRSPRPNHDDTPPPVPPKFMTMSPVPPLSPSSSSSTKGRISLPASLIVSRTPPIELSPVEKRPVFELRAETSPLKDVFELDSQPRVHTQRRASSRRRRDDSNRRSWWRANRASLFRGGSLGRGAGAGMQPLRSNPSHEHIPVPAILADVVERDRGRAKGRGRRPSQARTEKSLYEMDGEGVEGPAYSETGRRPSQNSGMNWNGMDYMRRMYDIRNAHR